MKVTTKAFRKESDGCFYSQPYPETVMALSWLDELDIPSTATTLWFELLDTLTDHSIPVNATMCEDEVVLESRHGESSFRAKEFIKENFQKLLDALPLSASFDCNDWRIELLFFGVHPAGRNLGDGIRHQPYARMHLQVYYK